MKEWNQYFYLDGGASCLPPYIYKNDFIKAQIDQSRKSSKKLEEIVFSKKPDSNLSENESEKLKLELFRAEKEIERLKNFEVELKDARAEIDRFRSSFENVILL